jgi:hypothetical protein
MPSWPKTQRLRRLTRGFLKRKLNTSVKSPLRARYFNCHICYSLLPESYFVRYIPPTEYEKSPPTEVPYACIPHLAPMPDSPDDPVCKRCIGEHMAHRYKTLGPSSVCRGCGIEGACREHWDARFVAAFFPQDARFDQYVHDMMSLYLHDASTPLVACPSCLEPGLVDAPYPGWPQVECARSRCKTRFCARCRVPWHAGESCADWRARRPDKEMTRHLEDEKSKMEDEVLQLWRNLSGKRCPNCNEVIEKADLWDMDESETKSLYSDEDPIKNAWLCCPACVTQFDWAAAPDATAGTKKPPLFVHYDTTYKEAGGCEADRMAQCGARSPGKVILGRIRRAGRSLLDRVKIV